ncbi:hypothetical protein L6654_38925 [Bradyrhizobium sp. WYCCWR 13023]|uniref:Uncharacterized protein n=1 Tax=Bradyrhizobium zhengyangense TaxID=2911009 RepID=A0A9X1RJL6_9BRAD|nr:hypothetical protein [Bradyrhizobium zhengyangense]MCG2632583.1 hypothetical protein [Bradyrhizobium zhengyangense]
MKQLKDSSEEVGNPTCPNCRVAMRWFRSELVRDNPTTIIAHLFVCPNCKRAQRQDTDFAPVVVPPDKLTSPRFQVIDGGKQATSKLFASWRRNREKVGTSAAPASLAVTTYGLF